MRKRGFSVSAGTSHFLHGDCDSDRSHLFDLNQRVGNIHCRMEDCTAVNTCGIDGIGGGCVDALDVESWTGDGYAGGIGLDFDDLLASGQGPGKNVWTNLDLTD